MLNNLRVRPSRSLSKTFSLLMGSSRCFGSDTNNNRRAINTRFRCGSIRKDLAFCLHQLLCSFFNRHTVTLSNSAPIACKHTVSCSISLPSPGFFSPFLRSTCSLSVASQYLGLPDGPGRFIQGFTCPALLGILMRFRRCRLPDCHRLWCTFSGSFS